MIKSNLISEIGKHFKERGLCNSGLKAKSTTFVRNITTIRLWSQIVILKMNINMTDNKVENIIIEQSRNRNHDN